MVGELEETAAQSLWGCSAGPRERVRDNSTGYREEGWRGIACRSDEGRLSDSVQRETPIFLASSQPRGLGMYPPPSPFWAKLPTHAQTCSLALHTVLSPPSSMAMRQVVSYDDITLPTAAASGQPIATPGPPPKKRKVNNTPRNSNARSAQYTQHWDEPDSSALQINYDEGVGDVAMGAQEEVEEGEEEEEESRNLTHEEIWDDSALVNAWDSAMAEYEVCFTSASIGPRMY